MTSNNGRRCGLSGLGSIYYDLDRINIKSDPTSTRSTAFEAAFLGDVIEELDNPCFKFFQNCKSQYPVIDRSNYNKWITSIDQDNRIALAHVLEQSQVPILYNTPRLCDPGMKISKNWSLKNYIETRLFEFKFKYNEGARSVTRSQSCYPRVVFDFRPFEYKLNLPLPKKIVGKQAATPLYVTEWIEIEERSDVDLGYVPHIRISKSQFTKNSSYNTKSILVKLIKQIFKLPFGGSMRSIISEALNIGPGGTNENTFISKFIKFLEEYDGLTYDPTPVTDIQTINLENDVLTVLYYDMLHDSIFNKKYLPFGKKQDDKKILKNTPSKLRGKTFNGLFINEFYNFKGPVEIKGLAGAKVVQTAFSENPRILEGNKIPALFKTLGDLSQFMYASRYNTVVASGDKMGIATGLYINAKNNRKIKCLIEDSVTGFVLYSGFDDTITFTDKRGSCVTVRNGQNQVCPIQTNITNKSEIAKRIRASASNQNEVKSILNSKPPRLGKLPTLWLNSQNLNTATVNTVANTIIKYKDYWTEDDFNKLVQVRSKYANKISGEKLGRIGAIINGLGPNLPMGAVTRATIKQPRTSIKSTRPSTTRANAVRTIQTQTRANQLQQRRMIPTLNNKKRNLRTYLNNKNKFTRLSQANINTFVSKLNQNGANMDTIKRNAIKLQRTKALNASLNQLNLTPNQKNLLRRNLNVPNMTLNAIVNKAKQLAAKRPANGTPNNSRPVTRPRR